MKEIEKLGKILIDNDISFERIIDKTPMLDCRCNKKVDHTNQIMIDRGFVKISCICHLGSYGVDKGLIELYDFHNEPFGHLTAKQAWEIIKERLKL